ncbi:hypothetical protein GJ496_009285 [Pomphorhynchus laevis]|nr:hypothetical protein GJ496_009285 [Pomphorhynchus laevis]
MCLLTITRTPGLLHLRCMSKSRQENNEQHMLLDDEISSSQKSLKFHRATQNFFQWRSSTGQVFGLHFPEECNCDYVNKLFCELTHQYQIITESERFNQYKTDRPNYSVRKHPSIIQETDTNAYEQNLNEAQYNQLDMYTESDQSSSSFPIPSSTPPPPPAPPLPSMIANILPHGHNERCKATLDTAKSVITSIDKARLQTCNNFMQEIQQRIGKLKARAEENISVGTGSSYQTNITTSARQSALRIKGSVFNDQNCKSHQSGAANSANGFSGDEHQSTIISPIVNGIEGSQQCLCSTIDSIKAEIVNSIVEQLRMDLKCMKREILDAIATKRF